MRAVRSVLVVLLVVLAGCTSLTPSPAYVPLPNDVPAPPPADDFGPVSFVEPAKGLPQVEVKGRVVTTDGRAIPGALLWVEGADLREPVNNMPSYLARRTQTLLRTGDDGGYSFVLDKGFFFLTASAPGYHMHRFQPDLDQPVVRHDVVMRRDTIEVVGHRGAYYYAPENTEASLVKAKWLGIDIVELDVRITKDNVLVAMHDRDLFRTTGYSGEVHQTPYATIKRLEAGAWFGEDFRGQKVPTLDDMFAWAETHDIGLVLDVKVPHDDPVARDRTWEGTLDAVERWGFEDRAIFSSFNKDGVRACAARETQRCAYMTNDESKQRTAVHEASSLGASMLMLRRSMPDVFMVTQARDAGIELHVWGLNAPADWARMQALGIRSWGTDRPGYVLDHLNAS